MKNLVLFCALQAQGAIPEQEVYYDTDLANTVSYFHFYNLFQFSDTKVSVSTEVSDDFSSCQCDVTYGACDANCCCDTECSDELRTFWNTNPQTMCKDYQSRQAILTLAECQAEINVPLIEDLQMGLAYFGKKTRSLMCSAKVGQFSDTQKFISMQDPPADNAAFDTLYDQAIRDFDIQSYDSAPVESTQNYFANLGY